MKTRGFIYLWYDRKHKRYYLGKHWGEPDDGYICSSKWMKKAYKRRPQDFKNRKILEWVNTNRKDLGEAERKWGLFLKEEELGTRYYNLKRPGDGSWSEDPDQYLTVVAKISKSVKKSHARPEIKEKICLANKRQGEKTRGIPRNPSVVQKVAASNRGKKRSEEARLNMSRVEKKSLTCSVCGKEGKGSIMYRWHFDNCKAS